MSSPNIGRTPSALRQQVQQPKPGTFKAGVGATHNIKQDDFITIAEAIQAPENQRKLAALPGEFKLKGDLKFNKPSRETVTVEYFQWTPPPISKAGKWSSYNLEFKLEPRRQNEASTEFVQRSLDQATRIYQALHGNNVDPPNKKGSIIHSPYISPKLIRHRNGGIEKYEAAKPVFAERQAELAALSKKGVKVKMLKDGDIHIRVAGPHFYSSALFDKKIALPAGTTAEGIGAFVNKNIDYARSLAVSKGRTLEIPVATATSRSQSGGGLTGASAVTSNNNIDADEAFARQLQEQELAATRQQVPEDTSGDEEVARQLHAQLSAENGNPGGLTGASAASRPQPRTATQVRSANSPLTMPVLDDDELQRELDALANASDDGEEEKADVPSLAEIQRTATTGVHNGRKPPAPPQQSTRPTRLLNTAQQQTPNIQPPPRPLRTIALSNAFGSQEQPQGTVVAGNTGAKKPPAPPPRKLGQGLPTVDARQSQTVVAPGNLHGAFAAQAAERVRQRNGDGASASAQSPIQQQKSSNPFDDSELAML